MMAPGRVAWLALAALAGTACAPAARPAPPPVPAPATTFSPAAPEAPTVLRLERPVVPVTAAEVAQEAGAVFGAAPESGRDAATPAEGDGPSWDLDVASFAEHARVSRYVEQFSGSARTRIGARLSRGTRYEGMIREKLRAGGLPEDLYYLALVESGFDPDAYSRAAAVGMWQFMTTTAKGLGLRVDRWVDERRDPVRATDAAVRFLNGLNGQFGSLYLAAAAYNGGPGRVSRGLRKFDEELAGISGDSLFFALADQDYLRAETKNYVPQIIAAALIGKEPGRYGVAVDTQPPFAYDTLRVEALTPLAAVAQAAGVEPDVVGRLNPHVLRGVTPPGAAMVVRVPVGTSEGAAARLAALDSADRAAFRRVRTRKGETAKTFAARVGVPVGALAWFGPAPARASKGRLVAGQEIRVPTSAVLTLARDVPDPSIERYGTSSRRGRVHVVRRGESLSAIARRYGTTTARLMRLNGLRKAVVYAGQSLVVRGAPAASRSKVARAKGAATSAKRTPPGARRSRGASPKSSPPNVARRQSTTPRPR
ncbi:MAG: transglycosylase SLT domain-containing protein [Gemmatimonadota bacterium]|jgi:membrane-bound lytic murein transglycosylase D